jgi:hypothetical protein
LWRQTKSVQINAIKNRVIKPIELAIKAHEPPSNLMKIRTKRLADHERYKSLRDNGKKIDEKVQRGEDDYQVINIKLKEGLPKLSAKTKQIGALCSAIFVEIMAEWYDVWQQKLKIGLDQEADIPKDFEEIVVKFQRNFVFSSEALTSLGIVNGKFGNGYRNRLSNPGPSNSGLMDDGFLGYSKNRPPTLGSRSRGLSVNSDYSPSLPTPDFARGPGGQFTFSPIVTASPGLPHFNTRDFPIQSRPGSGSPATNDSPFGSRPHLPRPNTSRSYDSGGPARESIENARLPSGFASGSDSSYWFSTQANGSFSSSSRPLSGLFSSAMPPTDNVGFDGAQDSRRSSRASSYERERSRGYNVLYLAASLFEFNIDATKSEAGYPYLTYQAGEVGFDTIYL